MHRLRLHRPSPKSLSQWPPHPCILPRWQHLCLPAPASLAGSKLCLVARLQHQSSPWRPQHRPLATVTAVAVMAPATVNVMVSVAAIATQKAARPDVVKIVAMAVARALKAIPKLTVKVDATEVVVDAAAVVDAVAVATDKVNHKAKVRAQAAASALTPKARPRART